MIQVLLYMQDILFLTIPFLLPYIRRKTRLSAPPTNRVEIIIIAADLSISFTPNSFISVAKVATQGKYMVRTTLATTS